MYWLFGSIIVILIGVIVVQKQNSKKRTRDLYYIIEKVRSLMEERTLERVQLVTADETVRDLNEVINELLDYNHKNLVDYNRTRDAMKKMLSNVSHDLKTPLTVVLGYLEMLSIREETAGEVTRVYQKVQQVIQLINSFFDLAKLESGDKEIALSRIDLSECVRKEILNMSSILEKSGMEVEISIQGEEIFINGNEEALTRVMNNLISNAIKYGSDGRYLGVVVCEKEDGVIVKVIDHGKGIEKRHQQEVFDRLYRLEDSRCESNGGTGLGLSITKTLIEVMNGEIILHSIPFEETIFEVHFPALTCAGKEIVRNG